LEGPTMKFSVKKVKRRESDLGPSEKVLTKGNLMVKREVKLPPGDMCLHLLKINRILQS
jgi:hypothetical protein